MDGKRNRKNKADGHKRHIRDNKENKINRTNKENKSSKENRTNRENRVNEVNKEMGPTPTKQVWKPGTLVAPVPAVMVSCADKAGNSNIITIAWAGIVCSEPATVYISVMPRRFSHHMIEETGEYVINLTTKELSKATDYCGVVTGAKVDKWKACGLTRAKASTVSCPLIAEAPVNIECRVINKLALGSHDMFIAKVTAVDVDERYIDKNGRLELDRAGLIAYAHGEYFELGRKLGHFGYSVRKKA